MSPQPQHLSPLYDVPLRLLALCVPPARRKDWLAEWHAELWHILHTASARGTRHTRPTDDPLSVSHPRSLVVMFRSTLSLFARHRAALSFTRGALADALCLRSLAPFTFAPFTVAPRTTLRARFGSANTCVTILACVTLAAASAAILLPQVRSTLAALLLQEPSRTVTIWPDRLADSAFPLLPLQTVRAWQHRRQHLFAGFAFYQPVAKALHVNAHHAPELVIARADADTLDLLGVTHLQDVSATHPAPSASTRALPRLMLTESAWKQHFAGRADVLGQTIRVGLQPALLAGVIPDHIASVTTHVDAWLLLPEPLAAAIPDNTRVFVLARLAPDAAPALHPEDRWLMTVPGPADSAADYTCVSTAADAKAPGQIFASMLFLALLALPAITSVSLGDYDRPPASASHAAVSASRPAVSRRRLFLSLKIAFLLPASFLISLDLAYALPHAHPETPQYIQCLTAFVLLLFSTQWALHDQRRRCPTCLSLLTCPARVGQPSRNFLAWNGTELICGGGHGLLHIPELPTSWFSRPRWLHLDPSWSSLFIATT